MPDPAGLFNASLTAGTRSALDVEQGERLDQSASVDLVRSAVALNRDR